MDLFFLTLKFSLLKPTFQIAQEGVFTKIPIKKATIIMTINTYGAAKNEISIVKIKVNGALCIIQVIILHITLVITKILIIAITITITE
ncbi:hypothetical protein AVI52_12035 [Piscirickettsia salmonis]|nr:hypothetical protein AVI52_12035 [Piscirickettsia salmonis]